MDSPTTSSEPTPAPNDRLALALAHHTAATEKLSAAVDKLIASIAKLNALVKPDSVRPPDPADWWKGDRDEGQK